ncbi:MAG: GTP-dependent dephospho-CoA kinase family protein [Nitrososphaerales archaeon]
MRFSSDELRIFKKPVGVLIRNQEISLDSLSPYLKSELVVSVGDATTEKLFSLGVVPSIQIVDGREKREERKQVEKKGYATEIKCANPAGAISADAIAAVRKALNAEKPVRIIVEGEEDLIGAAVLALATDGSAMFYGQPLEGMVAVVINEDSKSRFREVINRIRSSNHSGNDDVVAG